MPGHDVRFRVRVRHTVMVRVRVERDLVYLYLLERLTVKPV